MEEDTATHTAAPKAEDRISIQQAHPEHFAQAETLRPLRHRLRGRTIDHGQYSDTGSDSATSNSDSSSEEEIDDLDERRLHTAARKARHLKRAKKYAKYKSFSMNEIYRSMSESGHKTDTKYILAHSHNWREMWGATLNILGKKQYLHMSPSMHAGNTQKSQYSDGSLPSLVPHPTARRDHSHLANTPLITNNRRAVGGGAKSADTNSHDHLNNNDEASVSSTVHSIKSFDSTTTRIERRERDKEKRIKAKALRKEHQKERDEFMRQFLNPKSGSSITNSDYSKKANKRYGAISNKANEVSATLRKIGNAMEYCLSKQERMDLVGRGNVELVEPTALRTRLQMFLDISITPREIHCLFKKFDPNSIGSVNMADVYGNAMSITGKKKKNKSKGSRASSRDSQQYNRSRGNITSKNMSNNSIHYSSDIPHNIDVHVSTELCDEKVNPLGELDGSMKCTVTVARAKAKRTSAHEQEEDNSVAEEVTDDEDAAYNSKHHRTTPSSRPRRRMDFTQTVKTDIHEDDMDYVKDEFDRLDELMDPPTPDHGMGSTQNVRDFNTLAESDSVNNIFLCSIDEDLQEECKSRTEGEQDEGEGREEKTRAELEKNLSAIGIEDLLDENEGTEKKEEYGEDSFEDSSMIMTPAK